MDADIFPLYFILHGTLRKQAALTSTYLMVDRLLKPQTELNDQQ